MYRLLVPIDKNEERTVKQTAHVKSLPMRREDVEVMVIHVDEADYKGSPPRDFEDIPGATAAVEEIDIAGFDCHGEKREGQISNTIIETADSFGADEIVMAGRKRSGVSEVVLGSTTRDMLKSAPCAVTVVG